MTTIATHLRPAPISTIRPLPWRRKLAFTAVALALFVVLVGIGGELAARLANHSVFTAAPVRAINVGTVKSAAYRFDSTLGYVPNPGKYPGDDYGNGRVDCTIDADGFRNNGQPRPAGVPILIVGDSFVFGDEVADADTFPASLERITSRPVLNGGVSGYGIDQMVMRAESLIDAHDPGIIVLAFVADDIVRCGYAKLWGLNKPYFVARGETLELCGVPVAPSGPRGGVIGWTVNHSYAVAEIASVNTRIGEWLYQTNTMNVDAACDPNRIAALLVRRLATDDRRVLIVALPSIYGTKGSRELLDAANDAGAETLDLTDTILPAHVGGHYTTEGNATVARAIAERLGELSWN